MMHYTKIRTVLGELTLVAEGKAVVGIVHEHGDVRMDKEFAAATRKDDDVLLQRAAKAVQHFLQGGAESFDFPMQPKGSKFQQKVWAEMRKIPYGETISYSEMAQRVGNPKAVRAVGSACGANPIPLAIPCHRVLRNDGSLGGFGWGLPVKHKLLWLETGEVDVLAA